MASLSNFSAPQGSNHVSNQDNLRLSECICPVCMCILIEPVIMPCKHELCMPCFQKNVQQASLCCPLCRKRISTWARRAARNNTLVDQRRWKQIKDAFPLKIGKRLANAEDEDDDEEEESQFFHVPNIAEPGEIREEYEKELQKVESEREIRAREEEQESRELIARLQAEEEACQREHEAIIRQDEELVRKIMAEGTPAHMRNSPKVTLLDRFVNRAASKTSTASASTSTTPRSSGENNTPRSPTLASLITPSRPQSYSLSPTPSTSRANTHSLILLDDATTSLSADLNVSPCLSHSSRSDSTASSEMSIVSVPSESHLPRLPPAPCRSESPDSLKLEMCHFKPIHASPKTPTRHVVNGRPVDPPIIMSTPRNLQDFKAKPQEAQQELPMASPVVTSWLKTLARARSDKVANSSKCLGPDTPPLPVLKLHHVSMPRFLVPPPTGVDDTKFSRRLGFDSLPSSSDHGESSATASTKPSSSLPSTSTHTSAHIPDRTSSMKPPQDINLATADPEQQGSTAAKIDDKRDHVPSLKIPTITVTGPVSVTGGITGDEIENPVHGGRGDGSTPPPGPSSPPVGGDRGPTHVSAGSPVQSGGKASLSVPPHNTKRDVDAMPLPLVKIADRADADVGKTNGVGGTLAADVEIPDQIHPLDTPKATENSANGEKPNTGVVMGKKTDKATENCSVVVTQKPEALVHTGSGDSVENVSNKRMSGKSNGKRSREYKAPPIVSDSDDDFVETSRPVKKPAQHHTPKKSPSRKLTVRSRESLPKPQDSTPTKSSVHQRVTRSQTTPKKNSDSVCAGSSPKKGKRASEDMVQCKQKTQPGNATPRKSHLPSERSKCQKQTSSISKGRPGHTSHNDVPERHGCGQSSDVNDPANDSSRVEVSEAPSCAEVITERSPLKRGRSTEDKENEVSNGEESPVEPPNKRTKTRSHEKQNVNELVSNSPARSASSSVRHFSVEYSPGEYGKTLKSFTKKTSTKNRGSKNTNSKQTKLCFVKSPPGSKLKQTKLGFISHKKESSRESSASVSRNPKQGTSSGVSTDDGSDADVDSESEQQNVPKILDRSCFASEEEYKFHLEEQDRLLAQQLQADFDLEAKLRLTAIRRKGSEGQYEFRRLSNPRNCKSRKTSTVSKAKASR